MSTKAMIALFAALVFGTAAVAVAIVNHEINASLAALDPESAPASVCPQNWAPGYDTTGAAIFREQATRGCPLSPRQPLRC